MRLGGDHIVTTANHPEASGHTGCINRTSFAILHSEATTAEATAETETLTAAPRATTAAAAINGS